MNQAIKIMSYLFVIFLGGCGDSGNSAKKEPGGVAAAYSKTDLKKIEGIEGKWKGMYNGQPFYEIYELMNDSTLRVTSFDWNGKDSSNTSKSYVGWFDDAFYLGNEKNYKVTAISDSQIFMLPNYKAANT